jgi:hypothetical protein
LPHPVGQHRSPIVVSLALHQVSSLVRFLFEGRDLTPVYPGL